MANKKHNTPTAMKWEDIHPQVKGLLLGPSNRPITSDGTVYACGCRQSQTISNDSWVLLCVYHLGWNDALDATTGLRFMGAGR